MYLLCLWIGRRAGGCVRAGGILMWRGVGDEGLRRCGALAGGGKKGKVGRGSVLGMGAMRYRVLMEEAIISPTAAALWL